MPAPSPGVSQQVQILANQWDNPPQSQEVLGLQKQAEQAAAAALRDTASAPSAQVAQAKTPIIKDSEKYYAHLENGIDTGAHVEGVLRARGHGLLIVKIARRGSAPARASSPAGSR